MSLADIDGALLTAVENLSLGGIPIAGENAPFTPPENSAWLEATIVPGSISTASLGVGGMDEHTGFMQLTFYVPLRKGRAPLIAYADTVRAEFIHGKGYTQNGQPVRIVSVERSGVQRSDKWARLVMTVNFEARTIRPEI